MKQMISKTPDVPDLSAQEINFLTEVTFGEDVAAKPCDALFVFGGTHCGHWEKTIEAYQKGLAEKIIVTGGVSPTGTPDSNWTYGKKPEAEVIVSHLLAAGISREVIFFENHSTNTLENVLFAKEIFDFGSIQSLMFVSKSHVAGRQQRTLAKHLPEHLTYVPYTFDATYEGIFISRQTWMTSEVGRSRVWGEYLRILHYGKKGDIQELVMDDEKESI